MKIKAKLHELIEKAASTYNGRVSVPVRIQVADLLDTNLIPEEQEIDVHDLLAEQHAIALIWDSEQVRNHYPHLTEEQAWDVLQECERHYKGEEGLNWDDIAETVMRLHPEPPARQWQGRIDVCITDTDGYGMGEVINRLREMAQLLAKDMPDVEADVDPGSVQLHESAETPANREASMKHDPIRAAAFAIGLDRRGEAAPADRLVGLLADARLWCDLNGQSFAVLDRHAYQQYLDSIHHETPSR